MKKNSNNKATNVLEDKVVVFNEGDLLIRQGQEPNQAYLIKKGTVSIEQGTEEKRKIIAKLSKGQIVGEMSIIKGYRCTANIRALDTVEAQPIPRAFLTKELGQTNIIIQKILYALIDRLYSETFQK